MKRRLRKKHHRRFLYNVVLDASQRSYWRSLLFGGEPGFALRIDAQHCNALPTYAVRALRRYRLSYRVYVVPGDQAHGWAPYVADGMVIFRFKSREFPEVHAFSANNPAVV